MGRTLWGTQTETFRGKKILRIAISKACEAIKDFQSEKIGGFLPDLHAANVRSLHSTFLSPWSISLRFANVVVPPQIPCMLNDIAFDSVTQYQLEICEVFERRRKWVFQENANNQRRLKILKGISLIIYHLQDSSLIEFKSSAIKLFHAIPDDTDDMSEAW